MRDGELGYLLDAKSPLVGGRGPSGSWDIFVSAFNDTERVQRTFDMVDARRKFWWLLPEYRYAAGDAVPSGAFTPSGSSEAELVDAGLITSGVVPGCGRVCIDITGFLPQHILYLLRRLPLIGAHEFDMIYTEPESYSERANTAFSLGDVDVVRQVAGFGGLHSPDMANDVLVVGVGYDHNLIGRVVLDKESARLIQLQCFPSLSADMYNESLLRLDRLSISSHGRVDEQLFFAAANDPFVTAAVLSGAVKAVRRAQPLTNLYLSPLATKPQVLGFGLYYLKECMSTATSIIYPFSALHSRGSSTGIGRTWVYPITIS